MGSVGLQERDAQRTYWKEHSSEATVEAMMLDSQASVIDKEERPEVRAGVVWAVVSGWSGEGGHTGSRHTCAPC